MATNTIYWKEEERARKWKPIPNTPEAKTQAIKQGAMFFTCLAFSDNGDGEPMRHGDLVLDFDDEQNPGNALQDLRTLCFYHLPGLFGVDPSELEYFASGLKGFHVVLPAKLLDAQGGDPLLHLIYKRMVSGWAVSFDLKTLDMSLYAGQKGKMFRICNVKRSNGHYKVPVSFEEARDLSIDDLIKLTKAPRKIDRIEVVICEVEELSNLYRTTRQLVHEELAERPEPVQLSEGARKRLSDNLPPCIAYILTKVPTKSDKINFNKLVMLLVTYFQMTGWEREAVWTKVQNFVTEYPHSDTYDTPEKRTEHFKSEWHYLSNNSNYSFHCGFVKGLGLPGTAFDCKDCIGKKEAANTPTIPLTDEAIERLTVKTTEQKSTEFPRDIMSGAAGDFAGVPIAHTWKHPWSSFMSHS